MQTIRKPVEDLRLGMYVARLDRPWLESPFLFQGFVLDREEDLHKLQSLCEYVEIDPEQSNIPVPQSNHRPISRPGPSSLASSARGEEAAGLDPSSLDLSVKEVRIERERTHQYLKQLFEDVRMGRAVDSDQARERVKSVVNSITKQPNVAIWLTQMKNQDEYTSLHCLNVCVLTVAFCHHLGYSGTDLESIAIGALLHDIGKAKIPGKILNKPGSLNDQEWKIMQEHPDIGFQLMSGVDDIPDVSLQIILGHHRRITGAGYPARFASEELDTPILATAIADVYDAMTSDRVYHRGLAADKVLRDMQKNALNTFGRELMDGFIRCVGIFPVGSAVELGNGQIALVISPGKTMRLLPTVMLLRDSQGKPQEKRQIVDLAMAASQNPGGHWHVHRVVEPGKHAITQEELTLGPSGIV